MAGADADFHRRDLFDAIARGEHPSWTLSVQIMPYEDAKTYRFNPFDLTKIWPHADYPLITVGTMTLNRNPENFFAQIEQAAFSPGNTVPGIGLSPDKMLLGRAFAYNDAQRNRIGTNFHQLPVNRPKVPVNTYMFDGQMTYQHSGAAPVYVPNSGGRPWADATGRPRRRLGVPTARWCAAPTPCTRRTTTSARPGTLVREVFNDAQRDRLVETGGGSLLGGVRGPCSSAPSTTGRTSIRHRQAIEETVPRGRSGAGRGHGRGLIMGGGRRAVQHINRLLPMVFPSLGRRLRRDARGARGGGGGGGRGGWARGREVEPDRVHPGPVPQRAPVSSIMSSSTLS